MSEQSELSRMVEDILQELKPWTTDIIDRVFRYIEEERDADWSRLYWEKRQAMGQEVVNKTIGKLVRRYIEKEYGTRVSSRYPCRQGSNLIKTGYTVLYGHDLQPCSKRESCPDRLGRSEPMASMRYNLQNIYALLIKGFSTDELWDFFSEKPDFLPFYNSLAENAAREEIINKLLEYAEQKLLLDIILIWAKEHNPARYEAHQPYYYEAHQPYYEENQPYVIHQFDDCNVELSEPVVKGMPIAVVADGYNVGLPEPVLKLRIDAAIPNQVTLGRVFDLAVSVRQRSSPVLDEDDLPQVRSGDVQVEWPEDEPFVRLRVQVSAPECEIHGENSCSFRLYKGQDAPVYYFQLTPKKLGEISIVVTVYQEDDRLGSARIHTVAHEEIVGKVQIEVISHSIRGQDKTRKEGIQRLITEHGRRLQILKEKEAVFGIDVPPNILIEIQDIEAEIARLEAELRELE